MSHLINIHERCYSYASMERDLQELAQEHPRLVSLEVVGESVDHRKLYCMRLHGTKPMAGAASKKEPDSCQIEKKSRAILVQASMHAREWKNTQLLMMMAEKFLRCYEADILWEGIPYRQLLKNFDLYLLPMVNPDGVQISQFGPDGIEDEDLREALRQRMSECKGKEAYIAKRWKGNARGVDLNRNFPIGFPCEEVYPGEKPLSEPESLALWDCISRWRPELVVNYHSCGQEIFYRDYFTGLEHISRRTGYPLVQETEKPNGSLGDLLSNENKYWCTLETGIGRAPVWHAQIYAWWFRHRDLLPMLLATVPSHTR